ncbi:TetR/AcrR family transcriptional regulator [Paenibacillus filicis]|uniref:TetR/AcrR family transcriptional regulator n=1 Tax=Paenibacillus gyeongsangnamensis TaxID=3388067 RepID=A0ABT4Q820_9BACL|nr:TetR/AcrR family transcriptional regulator [Paenibacillus filicis]MCZ8513023.1 TetR/AcrR family transcriptional regulator [Paenibacillus filicis]
MSDTPSMSASFQLILDTAEQLIREKGCRQTTLQDIIDRSGLSKGAIYHYVSGKDELFGLILKSKLETVGTRFQGAVDDPQTKDAVLPIRTIAQGMLQNTEKDEVPNKIFIYLLSQVDNPKVANILSELYAYSLRTTQQWIEKGQQYGTLPEQIDGAKMAALFMIFTYGLRVHRMLISEQADLNAEDLFGILFKSLKD